MMGLEDWWFYKLLVQDIETLEEISEQIDFPLQEHYLSTQINKDEEKSEGEGRIDSDYEFSGASLEHILKQEKEIQEIREDRLCFDLMLFGSIFIMALYHLCLFALRKTDRSFLYFGVFCFLIMLRLLTTGERYLVYFFPNIPWEIVIKIEYLSFYLSVPLLVLFAQSLFPREIPKRIPNLIVPIGIAFSCSVIFTPARIFSYTLQGYQIITIITIMYGLYVLVVASIRKRTGAFVFLLGFIVLALSAINDMMYVEKIIQTQ